MTDAPPCRLKVSRGPRFVDYFRSYRILVNGTEVGMIARNGVLDVEVPSGEVTIEARIDWGRSQPLTLAVAPNQTIEVNVANRWGSLLALWAVTFGSRSYLMLEHVRTT